MPRRSSDNDAEEKDGFYGRREKRQAKERDEARRLNDGFEILAETDEDIDAEDD